MRYLPIATFLGLSLLWGSEWMLTASLPPQPHLRALALQYGIAAGLLLPWAIHRRLWRRPLLSLVHVVIVGIGMLCLPQILIFIGNGRVPPAVSLVALAAVPVWLAVAAGS
jgi:drug/metabolite transporter (DMT)-like permease